MKGAPLGEQGPQPSSRPLPPASQPWTEALPLHRTQVLPLVPHPLVHSSYIAIMHLLCATVGSLLSLCCRWSYASWDILYFLTF